MILKKKESMIMRMDLQNKEKIVLELLDKLNNGDNSDKSLAFDLMGMLGNEITSESYESRLEIVEKRIKEHLEKKQK